MEIKSINQLSSNSTFLSVIIPCYNSGAYLEEAVNSVKQFCTNIDYEIIITNDGSTDEYTLSVLNNLCSQKCVVLNQENKGPAAARNTAVRASSGKYLFFLDSDNRIRKGYAYKGIKILETNKEIGVVYGKPLFFGETTEARFNTKAFDLDTLLFDNYIDICSIIRRKVWEDIGGFDEEKALIAHEDWEFWIRVALKGWKFYFIDEALFDYRLSTSSLVSKAVTEEKHTAMRSYVFKKHLPFFINKYRFYNQQYLFYRNDMQKPLRSFIKYLYKKYHKENL